SEEHHLTSGFGEIGFRNVKKPIREGLPFSPSPQLAPASENLEPTHCYEPSPVKREAVLNAALQYLRDQDEICRAAMALNANVASRHRDNPPNSNFNDCRKLLCVILHCFAQW
ncbi:Hypothetical predicted protein, partial [Olea europaea subsp. europaea]